MTPSEQMIQFFENKDYAKVIEVGSEVVHGTSPTPHDLLLFANSCVMLGQHKQAYAWFSRINAHCDSDDLYKQCALASMEAFRNI
jgi:hypothetical protein